MNLSTLSKSELLAKCTELGIPKCKTKRKDEIIQRITQLLAPLQPPCTHTHEHIEDTHDADLLKFTKCDVFTPDDISQRMAAKLHNYGSILEPSVGTGNLLKYINLDQYSRIDVYEIKPEYMDKIPFTNVNKYTADFIKTPIDNTYDNIIMNPPYIKIQDLSQEYRSYLKTNFDVLHNGLVDIYYAFIIKCLQLLKDDGVFVAITPNSYLYNKSSYNLRKYLFDNMLVDEIIDFKEKKVFTGASVYCCITVFCKTKKAHLVYNGVAIPYSEITRNYSLFNLQVNTRTLKDICKIRNGIATLRDNIYVHSAPKFNEPCWRIATTGATMKYIIYPYENGVILSEEKFKTDNPLTYDYLLQNKTELANRDKGHKTYPQWYAYGRTQSIKCNDTMCLYMPCFIDPKNIKNNLFKYQNVLHYSCLCIEPNEGVPLDDIITSITNNAQFISDNSSKRSAGWISVSSRVLYDIPLSQ
jgi:hypothetical protein